MSFANRIVLKRGAVGIASIKRRRSARSAAPPRAVASRTAKSSNSRAVLVRSRLRTSMGCGSAGRGASCAVPAVNSIWASSDRPTRRGNASPTSVSTCAERGGVSVPRSRRGGLIPGVQGQRRWHRRRRRRHRRRGGGGDLVRLRGGKRRARGDVAGGGRSEGRPRGGQPFRRATSDAASRAGGLAPGRSHPKGLLTRGEKQPRIRGK